MWPSIFDFSYCWFRKKTGASSFLIMILGGGVIPLIQNICDIDITSPNGILVFHGHILLRYSTSCFAYLAFYGFIALKY
jgi:fucose permease